MGTEQHKALVVFHQSVLFGFLSCVQVTDLSEWERKFGDTGEYIYRGAAEIDVDLVEVTEECEEAALRRYLSRTASQHWSIRRAEERLAELDKQQKTTAGGEYAQASDGHCAE